MDMVAVKDSRWITGESMTLPPGKIWRAALTYTRMLVIQYIKYILFGAENLDPGEKTRLCTMIKWVSQ